MSDFKRPAKLTPLVGTDDYPLWKSRIMNLLQTKMYDWAIHPDKSALPSVNDIKAEFRLISPHKELSPETLFSELQARKKDWEKGTRAAAEIILNTVSTNYKPVLVGKTPCEMWMYLETILQDNHPSVVVGIIATSSRRMMEPHQDVMEYCSAFVEDFNAAKAIMAKNGVQQDCDILLVEAKIRNSMLANMTNEYHHFTHRLLLNREKLEATNIQRMAQKLVRFANVGRRSGDQPGVVSPADRKGERNNGKAGPALRLTAEDDWEDVAGEW